MYFFYLGTHRLFELVESQLEGFQDFSNVTHKSKDTDGLEKVV